MTLGTEAAGTDVLAADDLLSLQEGETSRTFHLPPAKPRSQVEATSPAEPAAVPASLLWAAVATEWGVGGWEDWWGEKWGLTRCPITMAQERETPQGPCPAPVLPPQSKPSPRIMASLSTFPPMTTMWGGGDNPIPGLSRMSLGHQSALASPAQHQACLTGGQEQKAPISQL